MKKKLRRPYVKLVRSCITGKVVWIYRGLSSDACRKAYWRACRKEVERVRNWAATVARRKDAVIRLQTAVTESLPIAAELTPEQMEAVRELQAIARQEQPCHSEFYDHIMEERRRRQEDREIRRRMREREKQQNMNYDK